MVLHVDHAQDLPRRPSATSVTLLDPADVPGELELVRGVVRRARRHAPAELHQQARHGRPVRGRRHPDRQTSLIGGTRTAAGDTWGNPSAYRRNAPRRGRRPRGSASDASQAGTSENSSSRFGAIPRSDRPGELPDLLGEPPEGRVHPSSGVAVAVGGPHRGLQVCEFHRRGSVKGAWRGSVTGMQRLMNPQVTLCSPIVTPLVAFTVGRMVWKHAPPG